ncbi:hypothetical protein TNCT_653431, partial [Trichonephila clavata]
ACLESEDGTLWKAAREIRKQAPLYHPLTAKPKLPIVTQTSVSS